MFHYTNQNSAVSSSRRLTSGDRSMNDVYFHPYDDQDCVGPIPGRAATSGMTRSASDAASELNYSVNSSSTRGQSYSRQHSSNHQWEMEEEDDDEPMDILYEQEVLHGGRHHHSTGDLHSYQARHHDHSSDAPSQSACDMDPSSLDLQLASAADHLMALLQREANDYSVPLPVRYYPMEFTDENPSDKDGSPEGGAPSGDKPKGRTTIGPWRKRIASWMYDVVDHFQYDRNVVSIALRYIDQYVGYLLVQSDKQQQSNGRRGSTPSSSATPIKRRHFQLIAVTSLYLAIKVHGELMENDPVTGDEYDVVASLVHEVDGRAFLGKPLTKEEMQEDDDDDDDEDDEEVSSQESDDDLRAVSNKINELKRKHRKGRWNMARHLSQFGLPLGGHGSSSNGNSNSGEPPSRSSSGGAGKTSSSHKQPKAPHSGIPYKPRKRGMLSGPLRLHSFVELSRGLFTARDITDTEKKILVALNYVVNPPTSRRFAGELLRVLALCYADSIDRDGRGASTPDALAQAAERILGLDRREILTSVLENARGQIEGAASVPELSIGCLPSVVAYGAVLNAVEDEFDRIASSEDAAAINGASMAMEMEKNSSPQLEDFQRHYRRYSRNTSPTPTATTASSSSGSIESDRVLFLEAWKEQFLVTVFHATNCFLSPESRDIFAVREMLLDQQVKDAESAGQTTAGGSSASPTSSPTEVKHESMLKKRSPRSPRSVIFNSSNMSPSCTRMLRGGSFLARQSSSMTAPSSSSLLSPYDSRGRASSASSSSKSNSFHGVSAAAASAASAATSTYPHRAYYKQTSEPIAEVSSASASRYSRRSQTPEHFGSRSHHYERGSSNYESSTWRTCDAFHPPNPNPPFFSA